MIKALLALAASITLVWTLNIRQGDLPPIGHALRRTAHDGSNEVGTFVRLNHARIYAAYTAALAIYGSPAQNFVFANNEKDIAIWPNGHFPLKWRDQDKFILDGTNPAYDWQG